MGDPRIRLSEPTVGEEEAQAAARAVRDGHLVFGPDLPAFEAALPLLLTILGLEQHQAFSALAHPGYKHFVRLRFKKDGGRADGWVFGRVDPLAKDDEIVLVDRFTWLNPTRLAKT